MILCCSNKYGSKLSIADISGIANIIIAVFSLFLAYYIFIYQRQKDKKNKIETLNLQEQNIKLQWFKDLIIQPHLAEINSFYLQLHSIENQFQVSVITDSIRYNVVELIKAEHSKLRKSFTDLLRSVTPTLHTKIKLNLDTLIDSITNTVFDLNINLGVKTIYDKQVGALITYSQNDLITQIYNYKGF